MELRGGILTNCLLILFTTQIVVAAVSNVANDMDIKMKVYYNPMVPQIGNISISVPGALGIELKSPVGIPANWSIYLCSDALLNQGSQFFLIRSLSGCIQQLKFTTAVQPNAVLNTTIKFAGSLVSKYDTFPGWFLSNADGSEIGLIKKTANVERTHVLPFIEASQTLRLIPADYRFYPHTFHRRYLSPDKVVNDKHKARFSVIPTPELQSQPQSTLILGVGWTVRTIGQNLTAMSNYVTAFIAGLPQQSVGEAILELKSTTDVNLLEGYNISITTSRKIHIAGYTITGLFYGLQTILSLIQPDGTLPITEIRDKPNYPYRGIFLDLSYNFFGVGSLTKLLDVMSMYKLNKLSIGLSGDNAWRIEIPQYSILTAGTACKDFTRTTCPFNPFSAVADQSPTNPKFFTRADYTTLVKEARRRFVEIIPAIDMDSTIAARASLHSFDTTVPPSKFPEVHKCYRYKYVFFENVLKTLKQYHKDAGQPLRIVNIGGDNSHFFEEWKGHSQECMNHINTIVLPSAAERSRLLKEHLDTMYSIADGLGIQLSAYGSAFFNETQSMLNFANPSKVFAITQENVKELNARPQILAQSGYKVIHSAKDYLNLDHAIEPHPLEFGDNYATRYIDARRVYFYLPRNPCCNFMPDPFFWGYEESPEICAPRDHVYCKFPDQTENFEGIQAKLLTRKIHTEDQLFEALLPSLLVFADKAWHKASWESKFKPAPDSTPVSLETAHQQNLKGIAKKDEKWAALRNVIGNKELERLDRMGMKYNIPLPGIRLGAATKMNGQDWIPASTSVLYPGNLIPQMQIILQNSLQWVDVPANVVFGWNGQKITAVNPATNPNQVYDVTLFFRTRTADNKRLSRSDRMTNDEFFQPGTYDFDAVAGREAELALQKHQKEILDAKQQLQQKLQTMLQILQQQLQAHGGQNQAIMLEIAKVRAQQQMMQ